MNVINLSGKPLNAPLVEVSIPSDTMDELHQSIQSGGVGRLSDLLLRCQVDKLVFSTDAYPEQLYRSWPDIVVLVP